MLYNVYAEDYEGKRRFLGKCEGTNTGAGIFKLYAGECSDIEEVVIEQTEESKAAAILGRKGRKVNSPAQQEAARTNGKKGGRPRKEKANA